jgi:hypothetical protein
MYYKVFNKPPSHHGHRSAPEPSLVDKIQQAVGPGKSGNGSSGSNQGSSDKQSDKHSFVEFETKQKTNANSHKQTMSLTFCFVSRRGRHVDVGGDVCECAIDAESSG